MTFTSPASPWPAQAASALGWSLQNLSLSANAMLDGFAARTIRDAAADLITLKVGINIVNADGMRERVFESALHSFLDTIRDGHPTTPILLVSPIECPLQEETPGPLITDANGVRAAHREVESDAGALTASRIRQLVANVASARSQHDDALVYLDGRTLFSEQDVSLLTDGLHPNQEGADLIASRFVKELRDPTSPIAMVLASRQG
jgi:lysophospholipase L1-like esterase